MSDNKNLPVNKPARKNAKNKVVASPKKKPPAGGKRGRLSRDEERKIMEWVGKLPLREISRRLNRHVETIQAWIDLNKKPDDAKSPEGFKTAIRQELRQSLAWKNLQKEFTKEELEFFEEEYLKMMGQFKDDVLPSEEIQIFDFVKVNILVSRCLQRQHKTRQEIERTREDINDIRKAYASIDDMEKEKRDLVVALGNRITFLEGAEQSHINEYTKLQKEKADLTKALKATRDQRIQQVETGDKFIDVIKYFQKRDNQNKESKHVELMRQGTEKEYRRLTTPHKYVDDQTDLPILSAESVEEFDSLDDETSEQAE